MYRFFQALILPGRLHTFSENVVLLFCDFAPILGAENPKPSEPTLTLEPSEPDSA